MSNDSLASESSPEAPKIAVLACSVFERELALLARGALNIVQMRYFEMGLHEHPEVLRSTLQLHLNTLAEHPDIEAVVLVYGLCGRGTVGLAPLRHRLVIPRAHDCITLFLGSKEKYAEHQCGCPTCYYYTPGWNRGRRVPGPEAVQAMREQLSPKFDPEDVEFLLETTLNQWAMHDTATYVDLETDDSPRELAYAKKCAEWLGWRLEHLRGDPTLVRDLLRGNWDNGRFQIIEPGQILGHSPDEFIMRSELAQTELPDN